MWKRIKNVEKESIRVKQKEGKKVFFKCTTFLALSPTQVRVSKKKEKLRFHVGDVWNFKFIT